MKRYIKYAILAIAALVSASCSDDRSSYLKVYNWGDYIDESLIPEFEQWYKDQTGEDVKIIYQTFDINETMLSKIEKGHEDYDVVCPSDYIIERMLRNDLLLPINKDFGRTPSYIDESVSPFIKQLFGKMNASGKNANDYCAGYMWGTTGILYNEKYVTREEASTWNVIHNEKFSGKIFMKDAPLDVYGPLLMYIKRDEVASGKATLDDIMHDSSDESIAAVEEYIKQGKDLIAGWEADFGKEQMTQERGWLNFTWSGDAQWAVEEAEAVGVKLNYTVPQEGSDVWFDGWVIPKYARNVKAASYFINFLCKPENAIRNMDVIGYVSTIGGPQIMEAQTDSTFEAHDVSYFFGEGAESLCINPIQYPDKSVIERCSTMHDWGDDMPKLIGMWSRVKGDSANSWTIIIIAAAILGIAGAALAGKAGKNRRKKTRRTGSRRR